MENRKLDKDHEIKYFEGRLKEAVETRQYSIRKIDNLLLSISSAGLYVILETFKYCLEQGLSNQFILKISGLAFVLSIVFNFLSQFSGKKANEFDTKYNYKSIDKLVYSLKNDKEIRESDQKADDFSKLTNKYNYGSLALLSLGLITLIGFFFFTF